MGTPPLDIIEWVNKPTSEGFTALHLSAVKGKLVMFTQSLVKLLIMAGADIFKLTSIGLSVLHIAAQTDSPEIVAHFIEIGQDIEQRDYKEGTPLHWAAFTGSYNAASVLLASNCTVNPTDSDGRSPLHLAIIANQVRLVRLLLIKGASRKLKDFSGKTPPELALEMNRGKMLKMLRDPGICEYMGCKPLLKPYRRTRLNYFLIMLILVSMCSSNFVLLKDNSIEIAYGVIAVGIFLLIDGIVLECRDPGYCKSSGMSLSVRFMQKLYSTYKPTDVCADCAIMHPKRSKHCHYCDRCVFKFDHHCQWLSICIGGRNIGLFYVFIVGVLVVLSLMFTLDVISIVNEDDYYIFSVVSLVICFLLFVPVFLLFFIHTGNLCKGKTTNERFSEGRKDAGKSSGSCLANCYGMCFNKNTQDSLRVSFKTEQDYEITNEEF